MGQILFLAQVADKTMRDKKKILNREKCINMSLKMYMVFLTLLRIFGLLPEFLFIRKYILLHRGLHISDVEIYINVYTYIKFSDTLLTLIILFLVWPVLVYKMWRLHRSEFKHHGLAIVLYTIAFVIF